MTDLFHAATSRALKEKGMAIAASYPNDGWLVKAQATARLLAATNGECTIDNVLRICPRPDSISPNATGSVFAGKHWKVIGHTKTEKISGHAREIKIWALRENLPV